MKENSKNKALSNFSKGKYSYKDYLVVKEWFSEPRADDETKEQLLAQWEEITKENNGTDSSLNNIFEKIQYNILLEEKNAPRKFNIWAFYRQVAAILILPLLAVSLWYFMSLQPNVSGTRTQSWAEINAPDGARVEFFLPDGTKGWLNSGSKLKYPVTFGSERKVELTGEAWFDVIHKKDTAFIVSVPEMNVKVLGTKFNVSAYAEDGFTNVVLEKGKVEVQGKIGVFDQILSPNERICFNHATKSLVLDEVNAEHYSVWKDGYLLIDNESLDEVVNRLERWYNVNIEIQDEVLKKYRFKATFKDEPIEEVLKLIAKTTPIKYTIDGRTLDSNGLLIQKKITMKLK